MNLKTFFNKIRESYLNSTYNQNQNSNLKSIDEFVLEHLGKKHEFFYILNNKMSGYAIFFKESGMLDVNLDERISVNAYNQFKKIQNTLDLLSSFGKSNNAKFLLIKSLNILPYLPVNDIDLMISDSKLLEDFQSKNKEYIQSNETEPGKINFSPKDNFQFTKLSFHLDITWDGMKIEDFEIKNPWNGCYLLYPTVFINSPEIEAMIKLQECFLENIHFKLIDHLYVENFLPSKLDFVTSDKYPYFISFSDLVKYNKGALLRKNIQRYFGWQIYYNLTGKMPLRERADSCESI